MKPVAEFIVPERQHDANENRPLAVPLAAYRRNVPVEADVEIRQLAAADSAPIEYRAIQTAEQLPTLYRVFEEHGQPTGIRQRTRHRGRSSRTTATTARARSSLQRARKCRLPLAETLRIRERPAWGEFRFLRFAVRKRGGGQAALGFETAELARQRRRAMTWVRASRCLARATRDLARSGQGMGRDHARPVRRFWQSRCPGGVARRAGRRSGPLRSHLSRPRPLGSGSHSAGPSAEATNEKARQELARPLMERTRPATVRIDFADGRAAAGVLVEVAGGDSDGRARRSLVRVGRRA